MCFIYLSSCTYNREILENFAELFLEKTYVLFQGVFFGCFIHACLYDFEDLNLKIPAGQSGGKSNSLELCHNFFNNRPNRS